METVSEITGSAGALLFPKPNLPTANIFPYVPQSRSMEAGSEIYLRERWFERDERYRIWPTMLKRGVATDFDFTTSEEMARNPYYQDFLAPLGCQWFAGVLVAAGDDEWCLSIQHTTVQGPFRPQELKQLSKLSSCLGSAAALARAVGFSALNTALEAYEVSGRGVIAINRSGEVVRLNRKAEDLLGHGIRITRRRLLSDSVEATAALDRSLHKLIWSDQKSALMPPIRLPRNDLQPLLAYPVKLSAMAANIFGACQVLVVLIDPEKRDRAPVAVLQSAFGLTVAEARLASRLASGDSIEATADELGIAKETVRNQLKAVFAKTGTHRQAELVATIASALGLFF